jgi:hypothetical protein
MQGRFAGSLSRHWINWYRNLQPYFQDLARQSSQLFSTEKAMLD